jgi:MscS family membrane protein
VKEWLDTWHKLVESYGLWVDIIGIVLIALMILGLVRGILARLASRALTNQNLSLNFALQALKLPITVSIILTTLYSVIAFILPDSSWLPRLHQVFASIDVLIWGQFAYRTSRFYLKNLSKHSRVGSFIQPKTLPLLENTSSVLIVLFVAYLIFVTWNIDMTAWLASAGIIGVAIGFAAKDTIANLLSGVFILADSPYKIGDYVVIDTGERGKVTHIGLRSTRILTRDDLEVNVPNAIIANGKIVNESAGHSVKSRVRVPVGVAYGTDVDLVSRLLVEVAYAEPEVCHDPEPRTRFRLFGASSLDFELLVWIEDPEIRGRVVHHLNTAIYKTFAEHNVEIPFSQHDVHIKSWPKEMQPSIETE